MHTAKNYKMRNNKIKSMKIIFLGTGTSQGVPVIACKCDVCKSTNKMDKRLRTSVLIKVNDKTILIDAGPDFRQQMLTYNVNKLNAIMLTHEHRDHVAGLDDIRSYNYYTKKAMDIYAEKRVHKSIKDVFSYVFEENKYPGVPDMNLIEIDNNVFDIEGIKITPIRAKHLRLPVFGFRIGSFVYVTDANYIADEEKEKMKNADILVINALRKKEHISHFTLSEALQLINELSPRKAYITHISHQMGLHSKVQNQLPENVHLAYDGLLLQL